MIRRPAVALLVSVLTVSAALGVAQAASEPVKVMGSIDIGAGEHASDVSTVNGSIRIRDNAVVERAHSVNGSISLEPHASATELKTVNGSVHLEEGARVSGDVHTVNGSLTLDTGADVAGDLRNVNGQIRVAAAHVGGGIRTARGGIELGPNARIDGGIHVQKDTSIYESDAGEPPRVVVGPGSIVGGTLEFERPVRLYVSERATVGAVHGATAVRFSGEQPSR